MASEVALASGSLRRGWVSNPMVEAAVPESVTKKQVRDSSDMNL